MSRSPTNPYPSLRLAMIVQFAAGGALMPFVTILLRDRGLDYGQIGQIFFASAGTLLVFPFLWGMLADRFLPIDKVFTIVNSIAACALVVFWFQTSFWGSLLSFTAFYACFNPALSLINALSFHHLPNARAQFGPLRSWGSIGWMLPSVPIFFALAFAESTELGWLIWLSAGLCVGMAFLTFFLPHTPPGARSDHAATTNNPSKTGAVAYLPAVKRLLADPNYLTILISFFLMAGSFTLFVFYSPPFLVALGVEREWIGPIQCIGVLIEVILFRWQPRIVRTWSYPASILFGCLALILRHVLFACTTQIWLLCASYVLAGMVIVYYHIGVSVLVNSLAHVEVRATAQTLLVFFGSGMGPMFANWVAGKLAMAANDDLRPVFWFAACLAGLAALLIFVRRNHLKNPTPVSP